MEIVYVDALLSGPTVPSLPRVTRNVNIAGLSLFELESFGIMASLSSAPLVLSMQDVSTQADLKHFDRATSDVFRTMLNPDSLLNLSIS